MKFTALRPHQGDQWYDVGDEREADEHDVSHLVISGVLEKAAPAVLNKAEPALANKGKRK